jgi:hypothetical protein
VRLGFPFAHRLSLVDARAYGSGRYDEEAFARIFSGLAFLDFEFAGPIPIGGPVAPQSAAFELLALFGASRPIPHPAFGEIDLKADYRWPAMLVRGRSAGVLAAALRRLRQARLKPPPLNADALAGDNPHHLATALILPLNEMGLVSVLGAFSKAHEEVE